ncbi:hypothetical protein [Bacillus sp. EAC]|uniref:hypothetical protein n=1 Tax=Bacillus sp. EAC TaxID=1978338 RepID=UPI000B44749E|nr:hypothetical protein [Bacillus sp. EAC]
MSHNAKAQHLHKQFNSLHKKHNQSVIDFHKHHAAQIANCENGNSLLAKWERFVYNNGLKFIKSVKNTFH